MQLPAEVPSDGAVDAGLRMAGAQAYGAVAPRGDGTPRCWPGRRHQPCALQLAGRWFLVGMASRCSYLAEHSYQLEATAVTVAVPDGQSLTVSTFKKL